MRRANAMAIHEATTELTALEKRVRALHVNLEKMERTLDIADWVLMPAMVLLALYSLWSLFYDSGWWIVWDITMLTMAAVTCVNLILLRKRLHRHKDAYREAARIRKEWWGQ